MDFSQIFRIDVNEKTEKRKSKSADNKEIELTYLSWAWAWAEFKKIYPRATYEIKKFDGLPYMYDEKTGYMVWTSVTADDLTYDMWLPVMDGNNRAMKAEPYKINTKKGYEITVKAATMFDVNKAIMRCLAKNLAMFGLGLYIYAGEDLPETEENQPEATKTEKTKVVKITEKSANAENIIENSADNICPVCHKPTSAGALKAWGMCAECKKSEKKEVANEVSK